MGWDGMGWEWVRDRMRWNGMGCDCLLDGGPAGGCISHLRAFRTGSTLKKTDYQLSFGTSSPRHNVELLE